MQFFPFTRPERTAENNTVFFYLVLTNTLLWEETQTLTTIYEKETLHQTCIVQSIVDILVNRNKLNSHINEVDPRNGKKSKIYLTFITRDLALKHEINIKDIHGFPT